MFKLLSLFHIMFLLVSEYQILIGSMIRPSVSSYSGLIVVAWIISTCVGCTFNVTSQHIIIRIPFIVAFLLSVTIIVVGFISIAKTSSRRERFRRNYERCYLDVTHIRNKVVKSNWSLKYFAVIVFSYVVCASPWIVYQMNDGTFVRPMDIVPCGESNYLFGGLVVLMMYLVSFFFPSAVIIYFWFQQRRAGEYISARQRANECEVSEKLKSRYIIIHIYGKL